MARVGPAHTHLSVACDLASGAIEPAPDGRALVAVFNSPVATHLLHFAAETGYRTALVDPADSGSSNAFAGVDELTDIVITDHDRPELGDVLQAALALPARWIGVMGSIRHTAPHIAALRELGVPESDIARVHRPIGLNIGSRTPAEIAISTLAGLLADRNSRPGGFAFT